MRVTRMRVTLTWRKYFRRVFLSLGFFYLLISYNNCAQNSESSAPASSAVPQTSTATGLSAVNNFKTPAPNSMAGEDGYAFLMKEYFVPQCAACHSGGVAFPDFADRGHPHDSYLAAKYYFQKQDLIKRVTDNPYCRPDCTLDPRGDVYKAILTWLEHSSQ
jgi:hypothetical protein